MRSTMIAVLCVALFVGIMSAAFAATDEGLNGRSELMAAAAWVKASESGDSITGTVLAGTYGQFITPELEVQLTTMYATADIFDGDVSAWVLAPAVAYHFIPADEAASIVPYVGAGLAYASVKGGDESDSSTKLQYFAGAKFFIGGSYKTANKAVFLEYRHTNIELWSADVKTDIVWAGISCFLK
jgi:outer membrane protein W